MAPTTESRQATLNMAKALSNPVRSDILTILTRRTASPVEMAKELNESIYGGDLETSHVDYHVKRLVELKCAELVDTKPVRGATEHFYRASVRSFLDLPDLQELHPAVVLHYFGGAFRYALKDILEAAEGGTLDPRNDQHHMSDGLVLDEDGYAKALEILERAWHEVAAEEVRSTARLGKSNGESIGVSLSQFCFRMPTKGSKPPVPSTQEK